MLRRPKKTKLEVSIQQVSDKLFNILLYSDIVNVIEVSYGQDKSPFEKSNEQQAVSAAVMPESNEKASTEMSQSASAESATASSTPEATEASPSASPNPEAAASAAPSADSVTVQPQTSPAADAGYDASSQDTTLNTPAPKTFDMTASEETKPADDATTVPTEQGNDKLLMIDNITF